MDRYNLLPATDANAVERVFEAMLAMGTRSTTVGYQHAKRIQAALVNRRDWIEKANVEITKVVMLENENAILKHQLGELDKINKARIIRALANKPSEMRAVTGQKYRVMEGDAEHFMPRTIGHQVDILADFFMAHGIKMPVHFPERVEAVRAEMRKRNWRFQASSIT
jgi:hypothetical protein